MPYVITNGATYIKIGSDNRPTTTPTIESARPFDSKIKAQNVCACLPNTYKRLGFYVIPFGETDVIKDDIKDKPNAEVGYKGRKFAAVDGLDERFLDPEYVESEIRRFEEFVADFRNQSQLIHQQQLFTEAQIFDIEHAAEFLTCNAYQGFKLYKMLRDARVLRRKCKNALATLSFLEEVVTEGLIKRQTSSRLTDFKKRKFEPRALPEIFEEGGI
jgi:hypothetical protein